MYKNKTIVAIIPAKGKSMRIPNKNMKELYGKPLLKWTTDYCLSSLFIDDFFVSSDCEKILAFAENQCSAKIIFEPPNISKDELGTDAVISNALDGELILYDYIVLLQPTSPIREINMVDAALIHIADNPSLNSIVSVVDSPSLQWAYFNGKPRPNYDRKNRPLSQSLHRWIETGSMYIFKKDAFIKEGTRISYPVKLWECTGMGSGIDIDTLEDWVMTEAVMEHLILNNDFMCTP